MADSKPTLSKEILALKFGSNEIRSRSSTVFHSSSIEMTDTESSTALVHAARARAQTMDSPSLRVPLTNQGRKIGELGGKGWIYNPDGHTTDSYTTLASHMDALGGTIASRYKGDKRKDYTPGQFAAHAALLAFKGKDHKLKSEYGLLDAEIDKLKLHTSVIMGAETGRTPLAGVSNFLMLHRMKHSKDSSFTDSLTGIQKRQLSTQKTVMDPHTFLSAPYGSLDMMGHTQQALDTFPEQPADVFSKKSKQSFEDAWRSVVTPTQVPQETLMQGQKPKVKKVSDKFRAKGEGGIGFKDIALPNPQDLVDNEALRLKDYTAFKSRKHPDRADPKVALQKGVLKHFHEQPWESMKMHLGLDDKQSKPKSIFAPLPSDIHSSPMDLFSTARDTTTSHSFPSLSGDQPVKLFDIQRSAPRKRASSIPISSGSDSGGIFSSKSTFGSNLKNAFSSSKGLF